MSYHEWGYDHAEPCCSSEYLWSVLLKLLGELPPGTRILDVGCGNGDLAGRFLSMGHTVVGIDLSESGVAVARRTYPRGRFELLPGDDSLLEKLGEPPFDLVVSTEVVEHLYAPKPYARGCFTVLRSGGKFVCSTPYHGYLKNLVIAAMGGFDKHWGPMWDGGHIKFWSRNTLAELMTSTGFKNIQFAGAGRLPLLWKSMLLMGEKP